MSAVSILARFKLGWNHEQHYSVNVHHPRFELNTNLLLDSECVFEIVAFFYRPTLPVTTMSTEKLFLLITTEERQRLLTYFISLLRFGVNSQTCRDKNQEFESSSASRIAHLHKSSNKF